MSIFKKKVYFETTYHELDKFIAEKFGLPSFEGTLESSNDSQHTYSVSNNPDDPMLKWDKQDVEKAIKDKSCEYYSLGKVLDELCRRGELEPGEYLVEVSW